MQIEENTCKLRKQLHQFHYTRAPNTHNFERISVFGCVVSIWSILECCETDEDVFLIWGCFFFACIFFYLHVLSSVAAH